MNSNSEEGAGWVRALVVVCFDLDEGQKVEVAVPSALPARLEKEVSMVAFPDSNSCSETEAISKYVFRTPCGLWGWVCFKQKKDPTNRRGYAQKSFVVLTTYPFPVFFDKLSELLAYKLFPLDNQPLTAQLSQLYSQSLSWPSPQPLVSLQLPVLDYHIAVDIPNYLYDLGGSSLLKVENFPSARREKGASLEEIVAQQTRLQFGRFQEVKLTELFAGSLGQLWLLWEAALLNKAVLLMADSPLRASQAVLAAASLANPIEYAGELYPYVTVYDAHLGELQRAEGDVMLGGTNPLFLKLFAGGRVGVVEVGRGGPPKHLRPLRELCVAGGEQQQLVNESALRKFFYKVNCGLVGVVEEFLELQTNDLKFFNSKDFLRWLKKRSGEDPLAQLCESRSKQLAFWEEFVGTLNFGLLLRSKSVVRQRT